MNLREIELFGTLMRVGTTIETARLLGISQPAVSGQIKRLESRLGVALFHRTGNRLEATQEARDLFALAMPIFTTHTQLRAKLPELRDLAEKPVVISATPALVESFIGPILLQAGFADWKRRITLKVQSPEDDLRNGEADIGLQMALPPKAEFQAMAVGRTALVAVLKESDPLAARPSVTCEEIAARPMVCYNADWSPMGGTIRRAFQSRGLTYDPKCVVPFCANVCSLVRACGGVGIVDEMTARDYSMRGLVSRPIIDMPKVAIMAFHRRNEPVRAVVQDLLEAFSQHGQRLAKAERLGGSGLADKGKDLTVLPGDGHNSRGDK